MTTPDSSTPTTTSPQSPTPPSLGQVGYDAYGDRPGVHGPWKTFDGRDMPRWLKLEGPAGELTCDRWQVAAKAIIAEHEARQRKARVDAMLDLVMGHARFEAYGFGDSDDAITLRARQSHHRIVVSAELLAAAELLRRGGAVAYCLGRLFGEDVGPDLLDGQVDPFLLGLEEIASATAHLAAAKASLSTVRENKVSTEPVAELVDVTVAQLLVRVKMLAQPEPGAAPQS